MMHTTAILSLSLSRDSELLASGSADGCIKVWRVLTGACVRRYEAAHGGAVTSLAFSRDGTHLLSASLDGTARVHGLKSGRMLRELRGHDGFVHCAAYSSDCEHVVTGGADGTLRVWAARTGEPVAVTRMPSEHGETAAVLGLTLLPAGSGAAGSPQHFIACLGSDRLQVVTLGGALGMTFHADTMASSMPARFVAAAASPHGDWVYGLTQAGTLCCFRVASGKLEHRLVRASLRCHVAAWHSSTAAYISSRALRLRTRMLLQAYAITRITTPWLRSHATTR